MNSLPLTALLAAVTCLAACAAAPEREAGISARVAAALTDDTDYSDGVVGKDDVVIEGRKLMLDGVQYQVRGVDYAPIPIGGDNSSFYGAGNLEGDGGDTFGNPKFEEQLRQDITKMREMGVNTLRIYAMHPWDAQKGPSAMRSHKKFLDMLWNDGQKPIRAYIAFAVSPSIFRYRQVPTPPSDGTWSVTTPQGETFVSDETAREEGWKFNGSQTAPERRKTDKAAYEALADEVGNHKAVLGFVLSNELNLVQNRSNPAFWAYMNELAGAVKTIAPKKHTIMALIDDNMESLQIVKAKGFDVSNIDSFGVNSYRGRLDPSVNVNDFDHLFEQFKEVSDKPLVITEFGAPATTRKEIVDSVGVPVLPPAGSMLIGACPKGPPIQMPDEAKAQADYIEGHWKHIDANKETVAGGLVFEWQDEYFKAGAHSNHVDTDLWQQSPSKASTTSFPGGCWDEEGFGINGVVNTRGGQYFPAGSFTDGRTPRAAFARLKVLWSSK